MIIDVCLRWYARVGWGQKVNSWAVQVGGRLGAAAGVYAPKNLQTAIKLP
jgi:hypothetical protein